MSETLSADQTMENELNELFGKPSAALPAEAPTEKSLGDPAPSDASPKEPIKEPDPATEGTKTPEEELLEKLDALDEPDGKTLVDDKAPKSALTDDQKAVLDVIPDPQTAVTMHQTVQNYTNFTSALAENRFGDVQQMLNKWNPAVWEGLIEHIYQEKKIELVDRFIKESDGTQPDNKELTALKKEVNALSSKLSAKDQEVAQTEAQKRAQQTFDGYRGYLTDLFNKIDFNEADRKWVINVIDSEASKNPQIWNAVRQGDFKAVQPIFKSACREYVTRDKTVKAQLEAKIQQQDKKKPPLGGGGAEAPAALPSDINSVPKDKRDAWMDQELNNLFKKK